MRNSQPDILAPAHARAGYGHSVLHTWLALLVLLLLSLASVRLELGLWNLLLGLLIAALKSLLVLARFMHLLRQEALLRLVFGAALFTLALLFGLTQVDVLTRATETAAVQAPASVRPLRQKGVFP